jgi:vanillate O-demethylase monooxygenase subunit
MFIHNAWYVAALASDLKAELFPRTVLNKHVVMYRTSDGKLAALEDRCSHRHVPLSKGCLVGDQVQCAYHGIRFNAGGTCVHIPSQKIIPQRASVKSFPLVEKYGFAWIWMGDRDLCDEALIPDHSVCTSPRHAGEMFYAHANTDYRLGIDNFLDPSHVSFVHLSTVMSQAVTEASPEITVTPNEVRVRRILRMEKSSPLLKKMMNLEHIDRIQDAIFFPVGNTRIDTTAHPPGQPEGMNMRISTLGIFTPETETTCHLWAGLYRDFGIDSQPLSDAIARELRTTIAEDVYICQQAQANWDNDAVFIHLAVDQASIAARQILDVLLQKETQVLPPTLVKSA